MNGFCPEGTGIVPEFIKINTEAEILEGKDNQLEFALALLKEVF